MCQVVTGGRHLGAARSSLGLDAQHRPGVGEVDELVERPRSPRRRWRVRRSAPRAGAYRCNAAPVDGAVTTTLRRGGHGPDLSGARRNDG